MNTFKTGLLMAVLTTLLVLAGNAIGGRGGAMFAFLLALVMNFGSYWFSDQIVLKMYRGRELSRHPGSGQAVPEDPMGEVPIGTGNPLQRPHGIAGNRKVLRDW